MSSTLSREERERILKTIEEDREFRYALMGLLGFREILDRITRLEEHFARLEERQQKLEERMVKLEERQQKLEENQQRLEERFAKLEERFARLEERYQKLEERVARLEERQQRLEERQQKLEERMLKLEERMLGVEEELRDTRRVLNVIAHRFGILAEESFREAMKYVVEETLGVARVEKKTLYDDKGIVYGYPSLIDIDLVVRDNVHILVEVKSRVSRSDVAELYRIGQVYEEKTGVKPKLVIVAGFIDRGVRELARKLGVEIRPITRDYEEEF